MSPKSSLWLVASGNSSDKYTFKFRLLRLGGASPSGKFWLNQTSATVFGLDKDGHTAFLENLLPAADGSINISLDLRRYKSSFDQYLLSFRKPGFDGRVQVVSSLAELKPVTLTRIDPDANGPPVVLHLADAARGRASFAAEIADLPIPGERSTDSLALLQPGVVPAPAGGTVNGPGIAPTVGSPGELAVNGIRPRMNSFVTDGADDSDEAVGVRRQGFVFPGPYVLESIREFQSLTALYDAPDGRASGGQFNLLTQLGRDTLRGKLYGYWADAALYSRNYFNPNYSKDSVPGSIYLDPSGKVHQIGYTAGSKDADSNGSVGLALSFPLGHNTFISLNSEGRLTVAQETHTSQCRPSPSAA